MLSKEGQTIRQLLLENAKKNFASPSIDEARVNLEMMASRRPLLAGTYIEPETTVGVPCEWVLFSNAQKEKVVLFLHGGGYTIGSSKASRGLLSNLSSAFGVRILSVDFRQAPEHPFPAAVEDTTAVYCWMLDQGIEAKNIVLMGESSGGGLALATLLSLRDSDVKLPACSVLLSPWTDLACSGHSMISNVDSDPMNDPTTAKRFAMLYAGTTDVRHALISPLYADLKGLPPLLIQVGSCEVFLDDSLGVAEKAKREGCEVTLDIWEGMWHAWHNFAPQLPEGRRAIEKIAKFIHEKCKINEIYR